MSMYDHPFFLEEPIGNNAFSYDQRRAAGSACRLFVPSLIRGSLADVQLGQEIVFEEIDHK